MERTLATIPDEDAIAFLLEQRNKLRNQQAEARARLSIVEEDIFKTNKQVDKLAEQLKREHSKGVEAIKQNNRDARIIDHAKRATQTLAIFKKRLLDQHAGKLGELVQESFSHLIRKEALTSKIRIDPKTCSLSLFDEDGNSIPASRLSAGERQLLAVSLLWGLARAAGRPLPIVVDTPLGRLDGAHRVNLVSRYFPQASHQVIVLSTDEEIDVNLITLVKPYLSHTYLLEYLNAHKCSTIRKGYFSDVEAVL